MTKPVKNQPEHKFHNVNKAMTHTAGTVNEYVVHLYLFPQMIYYNKQK